MNPVRLLLSRVLPFALIALLAVIVRSLLPADTFQQVGVLVFVGAFFLIIALSSIRIRRKPSPLIKQEVKPE